MATLGAERTARSHAEAAIRAAERLERASRAADPIAENLVQSGLGYAVDQVMSEAGLHAPRLAARAVVEAQGDLAEAAFMLRAYRATLARLGSTPPLRTATMRLSRRISPTFKQVPGGHTLGPTRDYSQRLLGLEPLPLPPATGVAPAPAGEGPAGEGVVAHRVTALLREEGVVRAPRHSVAGEEPFDVTRTPLTIPAPRSARLQALARGDTGALTALAYSSQRGFGPLHPTIAELRVGHLPVTIEHPLTRATVEIGEVVCTETEVVGKSVAAADAEADHGTDDDHGAAPPAMGLGYGLVLGRNERKSIAMALLDGTIGAGRARAQGPTAPAEDEELVLHHVDGVEAGGFVEHLKLPHHVTFQSALDRVRRVGWGSGERPRRPPSNEEATVDGQ